MATYTYNYVDTLNDVVDCEALVAECITASLPVTFVTCHDATAIFVVTTSIGLTGGEITTLDGVVAAHTGAPFVQPAQILAVGDAILANAVLIRVAGNGGARTLTSTPTIADGEDGQVIVIEGTSDANTVTVQDEASLATSNLSLSGGTNFTFGLGDTLQLMFSATTSTWVELSRSDN